MTRARILLSLLFLLGALLETAPGAVIFQGIGDGVVEDKDVSAAVTFEVDGSNLVITVTNTGTRNDYTMAQVLTDVTFSTNMADLVFVVTPEDEELGSRVDVAPGSSLYYDSAIADGITNISKEWGLASTVMLPDASNPGETLGPFQFSVTGTAPLPYNGEDSIQVLADGEIEPSSTFLNGGDFGLINMESLAKVTRNHYAVSDSVVITLVTDGLDLSELEITSAAFSYGSAHEAVGIMDDPDPNPQPEPVPEPTALAIWALLGAVATGGASLRRRGRIGE